MFVKQLRQPSTPLLYNIYSRAPQAWEIKLLFNSCYTFTVTKVRTKLLFRALNKHQARLSRMEITEARLYFEKISSVRYKPKVYEISERLIDCKEHSLKVRIYRPKGTSRATIIYFHGGGFVVGSIESHDFVTRLLCKTTGCSVLSVDYRLAPEHPYPAAIDDGIAALGWLLKNNDGLNTQRIFLGGDSAGGHIALNVAMQTTKSQQEYITGLILMYPSLDPSLSTESMRKYAKGFFITKQDLKNFWRLYKGSKQIEWPMPDSQCTKLPPTLIQTAEHDILRDEGQLFSKQLTKNGVISEYRSYKDMAHGFMQMPTVVSKRSKAMRDIGKFINTLI